MATNLKSRTTSKANAKKSATITSESFINRLRKQSPWWSSIMDPIEGAGAKIPDPCGWRTAAYQYVKRLSVAVNANGVAGCRVISAYPCQTIGSTGGNAGNFQVTDNATAIATNLAWANLTGTPGNSQFFDEINSALCNGASSLASLIRPVSGCVMATYTGTDLSDAGTMVSYANGAGLESFTTSDSRLRSLYGASVLPVKSNRVGIARLLPIQRLNTAYSGTGAPLTTNMLDYRQFVVANQDRSAGNSVAPATEFGVYMVGGTASTGSLDITIVINYEFVPRFSSSGLIQADASPVDILEESFVVGTLSTEDSAGSVSLKQYSSSPSASQVVSSERAEASGPLSPLKEAAGFVGSVLEIGLPLLSALL